MVKKLCAMLVCTIGIVIMEGCSSNDKDPQSEKDGVKSNVSVQDIAQAEEVPLQEQKITMLKYAPAKGDVYSYKVSQLEEIQEDSLKVVQKITSYYTKTINALRSGGSIEMTVRIDSLFISNSMPDPTKPGQTMVKTYDSRKKADRENPDLRDFSAVIGEDVRIILDSKGRVEEIGGLTPIINKILGDKRDSVAPEIKSRITSSLEGQMFRLTVASEVIPFPDKSLDSSYSWTREEVNPLSGLFRANSRSTYKLSNVKKVGDKRVGMIGAKLYAEVLKPRETNGNVEMSLSSSSIGGDGEMIIDIDKGYTIKKNTQVMSDLVGSIKDLRTKNERKIHQKTLTKISVELLR